MDLDEQDDHVFEDAEFAYDAKAAIGKKDQLLLTQEDAVFLKWSSYRILNFRNQSIAFEAYMMLVQEQGGCDIQRTG
jgi:hypothetical protein